DISLLQAYLNEKTLSSASQDYVYFIKNTIASIDILLNLQDKVRREQEIKKLQAITKIFFDPRGNMYEFCAELTKDEANKVRNVLSFLNYVAKYSDKITPGVLMIVRDSFTGTIPPADIRPSYMQRLKPSAPVDLKRFDDAFHSLLLRLQYSAGRLDPIALDYSRPKFAIEAIVFPKLEMRTFTPLQQPEATKEDIISKDMEDICIQIERPVESPV